MSEICGFVFPQTTSMVNACKDCFHGDHKDHEEKFVGEEEPRKPIFSVVVWFILVLFSYCMMTLMYYYAFKLVCQNGFSLSEFLLAYFFTLPYIIIKWIMASQK